MTQCERVLAYLKAEGSITQLDAVREFGCYRLGRVSGTCAARATKSRKRRSQNGTDSARRSALPNTDWRNEDVESNYHHGPVDPRR